MIKEIINDSYSPFARTIEYIEDNKVLGYLKYCLLYTSDAADEL